MSDSKLADLDPLAALAAADLLYAEDDTDGAAKYLTAAILKTFCSNAPTLQTPVLVTPLIDDGDAGVTVTSADQTHATPVATIPDIGDAADEFVMKDTAQNLTNKTLTSPKIDDGDADLTITSADQTHATPVATIPDIGDAADEFVMKDTTQTLTNKTLTSPLIDDGDAGITVTAADQTHATPVATIPDIGDAADEFVMKDTAQTLTNKSLILAKLSVAAGVTADVGSSQGDGAITTDVVEISTCANSGDAVTLPAAAAGLKVHIINNGANAADVFPASGDNCGGGVDTAVSLAAGANITYLAYDATNWVALT